MKPVIRLLLPLLAGMTACTENELYTADKKEISELQSAFCSCAKNEFRYVDSDDWKLVVTTCDERLLFSKHRVFSEVETELLEKYPDSTMTQIDWRISRAVVYNALSYCPNFQNKALGDIDEFMVEYRKVKEQSVPMDRFEKEREIEIMCRKVVDAIVDPDEEVDQLNTCFDKQSYFRKVKSDLAGLKQSVNVHQGVSPVIEQDLEKRVSLYFIGRDSLLYDLVLHFDRTAVYPKILSVEITSGANQE